MSGVLPAGSLGPIEVETSPGNRPVAIGRNGRMVKVQRLLGMRADQEKTDRGIATVRRVYTLLLSDLSQCTVHFDEASGEWFEGEHAPTAVGR